VLNRYRMSIMRESHLATCIGKTELTAMCMIRAIIEEIKEETTMSTAT